MLIAQSILSSVDMICNARIAIPAGQHTYDEPVSFGPIIRQYRIAAGLSGKELAELAGLAPSEISRYESDSSRPTDRKLAALEVALGLPRGQILVDAGLVSSEAVESIGTATHLRTGDAFHRENPGSLNQQILRALAEVSAKLDVLEAEIRNRPTTS